MSSINNNGNNNDAPYSANNDGHQATLQQLAEQRAELQTRRKTDKAIIDNKSANLDIIKLVGMTPQDAMAALNGSAKSNKYAAAGAVSNLPPPKAPRAPITAKTQALYTALHEDTDRALGSAAAGQAPLNFAALTPTMHAAASPAQAEAQVNQASAAATQLVKAGCAEFAKISSNQMTMAFMMLRSQGQEQGLNINNQMGDMQSAIRKADLDEEIKSNKEAQVKLDKAAKKQAVMKKLGPIFEAVVAVIMAVMTILTAGALGAALTIAATILGFVIGGAVGGAKNHKGFDLQSAVTGMSLGAAVVPVGAMLKVGMEAISKAVEKGIALTLKEATEKVGTKLGMKGAEDAGEVGVTSAAKAMQNRGDSLLSNTGEKSKKILDKAEKDASAAADRAIDEEVTQAKEAPNILHTAGQHIIQQVESLLPKSFREVFSDTQKAADGKFDRFKDKYGLSNEKGFATIENILLFSQAGSQAVQAGGNYAVQKENIKAQRDLLAGKQWDLLAKVAQNSWKGTQDFLSAMQEQHNTGMSQIQQLLNTHNQASMLAISHILG